VGKGLNENNIRKEMFAVYVGKCLSRKAVHKWIEKFSQGLWKVADDDRPGAAVAETTVKRLLCWGFDALVRRLDKYISVGGGYVEK
jgi:hypothetical protein